MPVVGGHGHDVARQTAALMQREQFVHAVVGEAGKHEDPRAASRLQPPG
ncbi:hypothetical protein VA596_24875 [Amycolatopsis sp., V23-08]|uniref:Uncharacterized protein n=1 Tax=Amycolatopsis heterodermiae TaxID=3110235 RepID=A0ABU5RAZ8_9PSEU|nr:hypothetical protein [Amycolatopsis sp., V23-08]MEA5362794.1 hypothetical protein [Amycolatopsis sp., V23-08]